MYAAEWPCCHDPLRFSLGSDDLSPQRGNPHSSDAQRSRSLLHFFSSCAPAARLLCWEASRARSALTRPPARGVRVCASRAHALTPFASLVLSPSFSSAFHLSSTPLAVRGAVLSPFEAIHFLDPLAGVAFSLISDESPGHAVRVCASRARPRTSTRFAFQYPQYSLGPHSQTAFSRGVLGSAYGANYAPAILFSFFPDYSRILAVFC